jgi:multidrug efflux pump subunit AcrA (membrane-fusion protein)
MLVCVFGCSKKQGDTPDAKSSSKQGDSGSGGSSSGSSGSGGSGSGGSGSSASGGSSEGKQGQAEPGTVKIDRANQPRAGIVLAEVETRTMPQLLTVPAQVAMDEAHTSHVGAIASGRVTAVFALPGQNVRRGAVLAQFHSDSVHETVGALVKAFADVDRQRSAVTFAQQAADRYTKLYAIQAASLEEKQRADQELKQAQQALTDAQADVHMEREHLSELLQVPPATLTPGNLYDRELIPIRSPMDGIVVARNVTVGQVVDSGFDAFDVSNLSTVWVMAAVNEKDIGLVRNGAGADVVTQAYADKAFPARVERVGDTLDPATRTIPVRISVRNPETQLRPGMFASAHIDGPRTRTALFVPEDALQDVNGNQVVFTTADGETFKAQIVKLGTRTKGKAEVIEGLKPGDHLVVNGAFMVKGELLKGTVGDG